MNNDALKRWRRKQLGVTTGTPPDGVYGCWSKIKTGWRRLMFLSELDRHTTGKYQWSRGTRAQQVTQNLLRIQEQNQGWRSLPSAAPSSQHLGILAVQSLHRAHSLFPSLHWIFPKHLSERGMKAFRRPPPHPPTPHGSLQKHLESIQRETDRVLKSWCGGTITERCREERNVTGFTPTTQPNTSTGGSAVDSKHDGFSERWRRECPAVGKTAALQEIIKSGSKLKQSVG